VDNWCGTKESRPPNLFIRPAIQKRRPSKERLFSIKKTFLTHERGKAGYRGTLSTGRPTLGRAGIRILGHEVECDSPSRGKIQTGIYQRRGKKGRRGWPDRMVREAGETFFGEGSNSEASQRRSADRGVRAQLAWFLQQARTQPGRRGRRGRRSLPVVVSEGPTSSSLQRGGRELPSLN